MSDDDTLRRLYHRQQAARKAEEDAAKAEVTDQFRRRIENELTAELRNALHLTISGTSATFRLKGRLFTVTWQWSSQPIKADAARREVEVRIVQG
jgi:hypothetical protein